ncbi:hypothetical protein [Arthrobacter sp. 92]|uniref:hypothetical protein n=1 Tax=Arthrobacter sp. 92 TaxID=3418175 RepID=UPI003D0290D2
MGIGKARTSYEEAAVSRGGNFVTNDQTLLSFTLWGRDSKIKGWEKYEGLPFPERMLVGQRATPGGRKPEGEDADYIVIQYTFEMRNGVPECVHLDIESQYGTQSVRAKDLEYLKIDDVLEATLNHLTEWGRKLPPPPHQRRAAVSGLMRRRRTLSDDVLLEVARIYEENIDAAPTQAVSDHFAISKSAADKRVKRARDAGYITKTAKSGRKPQQ